MDRLAPRRVDRRAGHWTVLLAPPPVERAEVTRDDTAAVLVALLDAPATSGQILELRAGDIDVDNAVKAHG